MSYTTDGIRNIALAGHAGAGKTCLMEALLLAGRSIAAAGSIERGSTVSDFDPLEKERQHSTLAAIAAIDRGEHHINLIDTPGHADFRGPALSALSAVETCAIVVNAAVGIEHGTRRMMEYARSRGLCRLLVINRIDTEGVDLEVLTNALREEFGPQCLPINLPAGNASSVVDCFFSPSGEADFDSVQAAHQRIIDQVVEINEQVMDRYLERGEQALSGAELHDSFQQCLREGHLVPICFVSAHSTAGVSELLDLIVRLLPNPAQGNPPPFCSGEGSEVRAVSVSADPQRHVLADVFKIINDPFIGKIGVFRLYQGSIRRDSSLLVDDGRKPFKASHLFRLQGKDHIDIAQVIAGDIAAVAKVEEIHFDAVLHDSHEDDHIHLQPLPFPQPMYALALQPAHAGQEQKLANALARLAEEDPCFRIEQHVELNETVVRGLSEQHLRLMLQRMQQRFAVEVTTRTPRIAYRETVSRAAEGQHRHKKQSGGAGQFAEVSLRVEPLPRGAGFAFSDALKGGVIPGNFVPAIEKGVREALTHGAIAGYPLQDLQVTVFDGKFHSVDSKEIAFVIAGRKAFLDALGKAGVIVLEPIVDMDVTLPEASMGDVSAGLASKRARINGTDSGSRGELMIRAAVPLAELTGYAAELKAQSGGRGRFSIQLSHYEAVPSAVQKRLVDAYHPKHEED
ncbi:MAG: elongation factor G [Dokdonella sp.]